MVETNTVIITTKEYQELLNCKIIVKNILKNCSAFGNIPEEYSYLFSVDKGLLNELFSNEVECARIRAYKEKENEGQKNVSRN